MFSGYRYRNRLEKIIGQWTEYRQMVLMRMGADDLKPPEERKFLKLKGKLVEELAGTSDQLGFDTAHEAQAHVRAIANLLNRFPSLYADTPLDGETRGDFEREWHSHFLFLNKLKGLDAASATDRDSRASAAAAAQAATKKSSGRRVVRALLRFTVLVAVGGVVIYFVPWGRLIPEQQRAKLNVHEVPSLLGSLLESISTSTRSLAGGGPLSAVERQYGPEVSTVLVALLLLAVGYWIFFRTK